MGPKETKSVYFRIKKDRATGLFLQEARGKKQEARINTDVM